jgi:hypothetical protein
MFEKIFDSSSSGLVRVQLLREGLHGPLLDSYSGERCIVATPISRPEGTSVRLSTSLTGQAIMLWLSRSGTTACLSAVGAAAGAARCPLILKRSDHSILCKASDANPTEKHGLRNETLHYNMGGITVAGRQVARGHRRANIRRCHSRPHRPQRLPPQARWAIHTQDESN